MATPKLKISISRAKTVRVARIGLSVITLGALVWTVLFIYLTLKNITDEQAVAEYSKQGSFEKLHTDSINEFWNEYNARISEPTETNLRRDPFAVVEEPATPVVPPPEPEMPPEQANPIDTGTVS